jgi:putative tryptophan/tyrosine transport system substrate-binding protein
MKEAFVAAPALGLTVVEINAALPADIDSAFETMQRERCDGLLVLADPRVVARIPELAARDRLPVIYQVGLFVRRGGLMSYGPDYIDLFRRTAVYVDKILKGADPSTLPVE